MGILVSQNLLQPFHNCIKELALAQARTASME